MCLRVSNCGIALLRHSHVLFSGAGVISFAVARDVDECFAHEQQVAASFPLEEHGRQTKVQEESGASAAAWRWWRHEESHRIPCSRSPPVRFSPTARW